MPFSGQTVPIPGESMTTVLVVEDDASVRSIIKQALQRGGHVVLEAGGLSDGLSLFTKTDGIGLVITDLVLERSRGHVVIDRIRELDGNVPIIAMSGEDDPHGPLHDAMLMGANMRLAKPFPIGDLLAAVDVLLASQDEQGTAG